MKSSIIITLLIVGGVLFAAPILFDALFVSHLNEVLQAAERSTTKNLSDYFTKWGFFTHLVCWITGVVLLSVGISSAKP